MGYGNKIEINISGESAIDFSGVSVSLNNDESILASVAFFNNGNGPDSGHVHVFEWTGSNWVQPRANIIVKVEVSMTTCKKSVVLSYYDVPMEVS
ncbi:hypothetical protein EB822_10980 [Flavobacteriaceae bacterium PRS1]|nr:hypothetical protein EB822_10980 [Flavobacteriaceae bacterium PRS1]